jgi:two-component system nitrogen regulation response regulator NtrX
VTARILVIDDEQNIRRMLRALLEQEGFEVGEAPGGRAAIEALDEADPDLALLDLVMPGGPDGLATLERLKATRPDLEVVMMSGRATLADAVRATQLGAAQFLEKPLAPEGLLATVRTVLELARARAENRALRDALGVEASLVGVSSAMDRVRALIGQVAPTEARVLITGESGTGKELAAHAIHRQGPRGARSFVSVNCAAIPRDLVESELFGHERGAFTGATARRRGKFELADGGTLFLDEVGDLGLEAQAKVLRALESGTIERVGGERTRNVDVRIIAATNHDLAHAASAGRFREDLLFRLDVVRLHIPPLRDRREDIPPLLEHLARRVAVHLGRPSVLFDPAAVTLLGRYPWPGNVRELRNAIERCAILGRDSVVTEGDVERVLGGPGVPPPTSDQTGSLTAALEQYERDLISTALSRANGNVAEAARRLETDRANLYRRMRRLDIDYRDNDE